VRRPAALRALAGAAAALLLAAAAPAAPGPKPGPESKCPVCGMFVARYPDWVAGAVMADGTTRWFDGAKDLFKWLLHPERYGPAAAAAGVQRLVVTDYYAVTPVDAREAFYVLGSDVLGPMGTELVPFARREDAEEFRKDHHGTAILRFAEVTDATIRVLQAVE
jgi:nitrous oxide reductase accessory protein NosL